MPGIAGIISTKAPAECQRLVSCMVDSMRHERFYVSALHFEPQMGVYAGSVAMDGSFAGGQVYFNEERSVALIFSGECFVDAEVGIRLEHNGHKIKTNKADWLVHLYEQEGDQFFKQLNGFFSGILIDQKTGQTVLFNDRYGLARLYVHESEDAIYFASEAKALLRILPKLREFDTEGVAQFLTFGCTLGRRTLFRDVRLLPEASLWSFKRLDCHKARYFYPESWEAQEPLSSQSFITQFEATFKRILPRYIDSESKTGISLTAGLDSRMIMACLPETGKNAICYTYSGQSIDTLDAQLAARVAEACGLEHTILRIRPDFFANFGAHADRTVYVTDGCFGITGAHEIYMSQQARLLSSTRLTGVFGGEVLRGVSTFKPIGLSPQLVTREMLASMKLSAEQFSGRQGHPVTSAAFQEIPWNLFGAMAACRSHLNLRSPYLDNDLVALAYRAPLTMRRSPLPALHVVRNNSRALSDISTDMGHLGNASGLSARWGRIFSRLTFKFDYINNEGLPHWLGSVDPLFRRFGFRVGILGLHKYLHYRSWFRREFADYVKSAVSDARTRGSSFWNSAFLGRMARDHIEGRKNYLSEINAVLTLEAVERLLFRELPFNLEKTDLPKIVSSVSNANSKVKHCGTTK
jgi:asparagine synthase (glutamine-hydrolysing)